MELYDLNKLNSIITQPNLIYATDDLTYGIALQPSSKALKRAYIQANNQKAINLLVLDLDHPNPLIYETVGLATPNFIIRDKSKNTSHLIYILENFITKDYERFGKNLKYFALIQQAYTKALNADPNYTNLIVKNPNNARWLTTNPNPYRAYSLDELADYVELPQKLTKKQAMGEGRNCYLFDTVRQWAYREVLFYKNNQATQSDFFNIVLNKLEKLNYFENAPSLAFNELKNIAKSISEWVWERFSNAEFSRIQSNRRKKAKAKLRGKLENEFSTTE